MKRIKKAQEGAKCGPNGCPGTRGKVGYGGSEGSMYLTRSGNSAKIVRPTKQDELKANMILESRERYERDFPGDVAPKGSGAEGKRGTRWKTTSKGNIRYGGQSKRGITLAKKKLGGKLAQRAAKAIVMKKKGIKSKKSK